MLAFSPLPLKMMCRVFNLYRHLHGAVDCKNPDVVHMVDPKYTFDVHGGIGQKPYVPSVTFIGDSCAFLLGAIAPAVLASRISLDMSTCIVTPRPDLVAAVSLTPPTIGCQSALELCDLKGDKQVLAFALSLTPLNLISLRCCNSEFCDIDEVLRVFCVRGWSQKIY
jgi:hypothetical protein